MKRNNKFYAERAIMCLKELLNTESTNVRTRMIEKVNRLWDFMLGECDALTCALLDIDTNLYYYERSCGDVRKRRAALIVADVKRAIEMFRDMAKYNA